MFIDDAGRASGRGSEVRKDMSIFWHIVAHPVHPMHSLWLLLLLAR